MANGQVRNPASGRSVGASSPGPVSNAGTLRAAWLGRVSYADGLDAQRDTHRLRVAGDVPDTVLLLEHGHVITLGRRGAPADLLATRVDLERLGVTVAETDRGGQTTYHGPGQLVCYPILNLRSAGLYPVSYVRLLEQITVDFLADHGVAAFPMEGETGVWTVGGKIASIGVRISSGVTTHGIAINLSTDLAYFSHIVPCGMPGMPAASVLGETGSSLAMQAAGMAWAARLGAALGLTLAEAAPGAASLS